MASDGAVDIRDLGVSNRTLNALWGGRILSVDEARVLTWDQAREIRNFGPASWQDLQRRLRAHGYLKPEPCVKKGKSPTVKSAMLGSVEVLYLTPEQREKEGTERPLIVRYGTSRQPLTFEQIVEFAGGLNDFVYAVSGLLTKEGLAE